MSKCNLEKCKGCVSEDNDNCPILRMPDIDSVDEWFDILKDNPCPVKILTAEAKAKQDM